MKKTLYLFLAIALTFSSCKKEEGCTDSQATNYNADAEEDDASCIYSLAGVWETTSAKLNGVEEMGQIGEDILFIWNDGSVAVFSSSTDGSPLMNGEGFYSVNSQNNFNLSLDIVLADGTQVSFSGSGGIDIMTNANNMTWRYDNYLNTGGIYVKKMVKSSTYSLSDW